MSGKSAPTRIVIEAEPKIKAAPVEQMAHPEMLRSLGTLLTPPVKLPPMTSAQAEALEMALTSVRREERGAILEDYLTKLK